MRAFLAIFFLFVYFFQAYYLGNLFFKGYLIDPDIWDKWYFTRCSIYEGLFFILILSSLSKKTIIGNSILIICLIITFFNFIDSAFLGINETLERDKIVFLFSIFIGLYYYYYASKKRK